MKIFLSLLFLSTFNVFNGNTQSSRIKVMSWNVFLRPGILCDGQMVRVPEISKYLLSSSADVLVLQEVFHRKSRRQLIQLLSDQYPFHTQEGPASFWGVSSGILVFSKDSILKESTASFSKARGSDRLAKKERYAFSSKTTNRIFTLSGLTFRLAAPKSHVRQRRSNLKP